MPASSAVLKLTIRFQGLCAFLRDQRQLEDTREVIAVLVAGRTASGDEFCPHGPALVFQGGDFQATEGKPTHFTVLDPSTASKRPSLGVWPLDGKEVRIIGAAASDLKLDRTFVQTADLDRLTGGNGIVSRECLSSAPPPDRLVAARVVLTSGVLSSSAVIGPGDEFGHWVFADAAAEPTSGDPVIFSSEVQYQFFGDAAPTMVILESRPIGGGDSVERLALNTNEGPVSVGISMLCPMELKSVEKEPDFLAYYHLLETMPPEKLIPQFLFNGLTHPVRAGMASCPPGTTFVAPGAGT